MKVPFLDLARAYEFIADEADARLFEVARSGAYVLGNNVAALEAAVADYLGTPHAVAVGSGTDALHLALAGLKLGPGDEIITTPFTFAATVEAIEYVGAQPVLVDIDPKTYNIDANRVEQAVNTNTKAVIPVHMFGLPANMPDIMQIAVSRGLQVVEDCAQSFGAAVNGQAAGSFGDAGAFSFYPTKTLGCLGDGGIISVKDAETDQRIRELRNHGIGDGAEHVALGFNSRLDELQAAILLVKLKQIDAMNDRRRKIAAHYNAVLSSAGAITPSSPDNARHVFGYYTILVDDREALRAKLADSGVATALYYPKPLHQHQHFAKSCNYGSLEIAESIVSRVVSLPIFPEMTDDEVDYVASTTAALLSSASD